MGGNRRVLIIGGSFCGLLCGRDLTHNFLVTIVDCKEFFEYTPGVLRAYVKPKHLDALTFTLQPVIESRMQAKFIWGEVLKLNEDRTALIQPMFMKDPEIIDFDYCIIASGCSFGPFHKYGDSLWFPTVHRSAIEDSATNQWQQFDERFLEGRRRHVMHEYNTVKELNAEKKSVLVTGAGFIGVEWVTEINHFFPDVKCTIIDMLPQCLGPLPKKAAQYCSNYMAKKGIKQFYNTAKNDKDPQFWKSIELDKATTGRDSDGPHKEYICIGVKATNYFMPPEVLSDKGPGGGKWILMDSKLSVKTKSGERWGAVGKAKGNGEDLPRFFAVGDCNYGCIESKSPPYAWEMPPMPKISYPGEEQAVIACGNLEKVDKMYFQNLDKDCCGNGIALHHMHWPWGAGMFATSLGPDDACFVAGANWTKGTGYTVTWASVAAVQKEIIEASITDEASYGLVGRLIWHFVHHTPVHLFGKGPLWGYTW